MDPNGYNRVRLAMNVSSNSSVRLGKFIMDEKEMVKHSVMKNELSTWSREKQYYFVKIVDNSVWETTKATIINSVVKQIYVAYTVI